MLSLPEVTTATARAVLIVSVGVASATGGTIATVRHVVVCLVNETRRLRRPETRGARRKRKKTDRGQDDEEWIVSGGLSSTKRNEWGRWMVKSTEAMGWMDGWRESRLPRWQKKKFARIQWSLFSEGSVQASPLVRAASPRYPAADRPQSDYVLCMYICSSIYPPYSVLVPISAAFHVAHERLRRPGERITEHDVVNQPCCTPACSRHGRSMLNIHAIMRPTT